MPQTDKPIERRKPAEKRKEAHLRVRISEAQMEIFKAAAESEGLTLSGWVTNRLLAAAKKEAKKA